MAAFKNEPLSGSTVFARAAAPWTTAGTINNSNNNNRSPSETQRVEHYRSEARDFRARLDRAEAAIGREQQRLHRLDRSVGNLTSMFLGGGLPITIFGRLLHASVLGAVGLTVLSVGLAGLTAWGLGRTWILRRSARFRAESFLCRRKANDYEGLAVAVTTSATHRLSALSKL